MRDERHIVMQIVRGDGQVAAAAPQLRAAVARQDEIQPELLDGAAVQFQAANLCGEDFVMTCSNICSLFLFVP